MHVLLAGATGAIGSEVLDLLNAAGHEVRTLSRDSTRVKLLHGRSRDVRLADATRGDALLGVCDGIDVVVSCLGANVSLSLRERRGFDAVDAVANERLLSEAKRAGVKRFVYLAALTDGDTLKTRYIASHERVVAALAKSGLTYSVVRPTGVFKIKMGWCDQDILVRREGSRDDTLKFGIPSCGFKPRLGKVEPDSPEASLATAWVTTPAMRRQRGSGPRTSSPENLNMLARPGSYPT